MENLEIVITIISSIVALITAIVSLINIQSSRKKHVDEFLDNRAQRKKNAKN